MYSGQIAHINVLRHLHLLTSPSQYHICQLSWNSLLGLELNFIGWTETGAGEKFTFLWDQRKRNRVDPLGKTLETCRSQSHLSDNKYSIFPLLSVKWKFVGKLVGNLNQIRRLGNISDLRPLIRVDYKHFGQAQFWLQYPEARESCHLPVFNFLIVNHFLFHLFCFSTSPVWRHFAAEENTI